MRQVAGVLEARAQTAPRGAAACRRRLQPSCSTLTHPTRSRPQATFADGKAAAAADGPAIAALVSDVFPDLAAKVQVGTMRRCCMLAACCGLFAFALPRCLGVSYAL